MARSHGKETVIKLASNDISAYCTTSELNRTADHHDSTGYGLDARTYVGGLLDGTFTCGGHYDTTAMTGPRAVIEPLLGTTVSVTRQPEGTGSSLPQDVFNLVVNSYVETNPFDGLVSWTMAGQVSGDVNSTAQSA